ncbi:MAG: hypothetical protein ABEH88_04760 [Halobacteriales archaeon]
MGDHGTVPGERLPEDCTTTESFSDHGIGDGADLVTRTYYRLRGSGASDPSSEGFFDRLESAFREVYLDAADGSEVPTHVELAIEDARALTKREFTDRPDADLRTDVVPTFYCRIAGFHCRYRV